jgi:hypothetical protein
MTSWKELDHEANFSIGHDHEVWFVRAREPELLFAKDVAARSGWATDLFLDSQ